MCRQRVQRLAFVVCPLVSSCEWCCALNDALLSGALFSGAVLTGAVCNMQGMNPIGEYPQDVIVALNRHNVPID